MRKYTLLVFMMLACVFTASSQMSVSFTGGNVDPGATIEVDVTVDGFTNLYGFQYSVAYDSSILEYTSITNVTDALGNNFNESNIGVPDGSTTLIPGQITTSLNLSQFASVPNGTRLYTIVFTGRAEPCDSTDIMGADFPLTSTYIDENFNEPPISFTNNKVYINGPDCGGGTGGGDDLTFTIANQNVAPAVEVCIPITMENFNNFNAGQGKIGWDPTVLSFVRVQEQIDGVFNDNTNNVGSGQYNFIWENLEPQNPVSLPDGTALFEMCFDVIGSVGDMTTMDMTSFASDWGFTDDTGAEPPLVLNNGKITITDTPSDPVIFNINDITIDENGTGCISVTVENFSDMLSFQGTFSWNDNIATYNTAQNFGLEGLGIEDFNNNIQDNNIRVSWSSGPNPETVADGTEIFQLCFDGVGSCEQAGSTLLDFIDVSGFNIEFIQLSNNSPVTIDYEINAGSISIAPCTGGCMMVSKTDVLCNGENTGSIIVSIDPGASSNCQCIWYKDGSTTPFMTLNAPNCNLINVGAGDYNLEVVCDGTTLCDNISATISQPSAININGAVTNIGCGQDKGSIVLSVNGGASGFSYDWNDPDMSTTKDIDNLDAGSYTVTVTDANECTETMTFMITEMVTTLSASVLTVNNVSCFGANDGSIVLDIAGGCTNNGNYNITPANLTNLGPGTYNITVADFSTPPQTVDLTMVVVTGPDAALEIFNGNTIETSGPGANDGSISFEIRGGTPNYTITWTGGIPDGTMNPTGLSANTYTATVTDANGCTTTMNFVVEDGEGGDAVRLNSLTTTPASCNGEEDGALNGSVSNGVGPYTIDLLDGSAVISTTSINVAGTFMLTGLQAGSFTVRVTDNDGGTDSRAVNILEPTAISFDVDIDCANGSNDDGSIDLTIAGGAGDYMVEWSTGDMTEDLDNVGVGNYSVLIEDANGCQSIINNIRVNDCNPTNCYEAIKLITPNGDGINDVFVINCVMQEQTSLTVYDRWGNEVFSQNNYDNTWSGIDADGEALIEGGYMWVLVVDFSDSRREVFKGTVTVLTEN